MKILYHLIPSVAAFFLGVHVSSLLCGANEKPNYRRNILVISGLLLLAQMISMLFLEMEVTKKLYPLIVHLPLWLLLVLLLKTPRLQTAVSILTAYLCCQLPRWVASLGLTLSEEHLLYPILYLIFASLFLFGFQRYLANSLRQFIGRSRRLCLLMGLVPALYYAFDYGTNIYTKLLHSGNPAAVEFMPSLLCMAYLLFLVLYNSELEKQRQLGRERDFLTLQLRQSKLAFSAMEQIQEKTRQYRHDMRHHFALLQTLAAENNIEKIQQYLSTATQDIDALTPIRYCSNDMVNLLLSYFAGIARAQEVNFAVKSALPSKLSYSETELCSLLSNGLENAIYAASLVSPPENRTVTIQLGIQGENLLIQIENTFSGTIRWQDGLPCTDRSEHGLGTQSIRAIARAHGGEAIFRVHNGLFQLRLFLPIAE